MSDEGLVYIGKIIELQPIEGADFIVSATVVCGPGGRWRGVCKKEEFQVGDLCNVFLPDSVIPEQDVLSFMKSSNWRVKMRRFKGAPSEVLIIPNNVIADPYGVFDWASVGTDITRINGVTKYHKPVPANLQGKAKGEFPGFIPKTDEPNYQNGEGQEGVEMLIGKPYYITEKADGSSTTAYKYKGQFGVCSRNWELERDEENGYWKVAIKYDLENRLPEGMAIQWETVGPKIQGNPMEWKEIHGLMFSAYNIVEKRYLEFIELCDLCKLLDFPGVMIVNVGASFSEEGIDLLGEGNYDNGKPREGVVVRSTTNLLGHKPVSFKVINLNYEK